MNSVPMPHLAPWKLLPAPDGTCPECAVKHEPDQPHNNQSMAYQYHFYGRIGRWPTWKDAIAHCTPEVQALWEAALRKRDAWTEPESA